MTFTTYQINDNGSFFNKEHFATLDEMNSWLKGLGQFESTTRAFGANFHITIKSESGLFVALSGDGRWFKGIAIHR